MSLETELIALLKVRCPRVFAGQAEPKTPVPYVVYTRIGGRPLGYVEGGQPDLRNATVQIDVTHKSRPDCDALAQQIEADLVGTLVFSAEALGESVFDDSVELGLYGTSQDFDIWADR